MAVSNYSFKDYILILLKKSYRFLSRVKFESPICITDRELSNELIFELLSNDKPSMIARFGTTELITLNNYLCVTSKKLYLQSVYNYITDNTHTPWWQKGNFHYLEVYSGVFPATEEMSIKFSNRYLEDTPSIDILGSFQYYEKFMPLKKDHVKVHLETLYPFFVDKPWTKVLEGKKVLVVHPFEDTIQLQYTKREKLFDNNDVLPEFELITLKSVQSAAGIKPPFKDWFEALEHMEKQISNIDFDICLLGCGAYGLPLAAHVKRMGKTAVHLGGGLQLLFGIKGKRWDPESNYGSWYENQSLFEKTYCDLYNDNWIRPLDIDTPEQSKNLDGGTYW
tara:strand:+ start:667 stop:1677 length:1011 start_codon:yes stop_codon:yes gene_type:complete